MGDDTKTEGLPIPGYRPQSRDAMDLVTEFKFAEERLLRKLDELKARGAEFDQRWLQIGRTGLEQAFTAINRGVFQPRRVELPEDEMIL